MKNIEIEARSKDEAISEGLASLGLSRSQVAIEVVDEGGRGFLGLGSKKVKVRLRALDEGEVDPADVVRGLLELMDVEFELQVSKHGDETDIRIDAPKDDGLLIGRRGQTLDALRHISQRILAARKGANVPVNIDVGDYRARREAGLVEKAEEVATDVIEGGQSITMDPMSAQDRRVIHLALAEREDVSTYTVGRGSRRCVVIAPPEENDETAYDKVPDPGFRSQRMPAAEGEAAAEESRSSRPRRERRDRDDGERRDEGRRRGRRPRRDRDDGAPREASGESSGEPNGNRREPEARPQRGERPERGERGERGGRGGRDGERRGRRRDGERGERGERGGRGRDGRGGRDRGRDDRTGDDHFGQDPSAPTATSKEDLSKAPVVTDDSGDKAFPTDLAKRVLQLEKGGASGSKRRRRR